MPDEQEHDDIDPRSQAGGGEGASDSEDLEAEYEALAPRGIPPIDFNIFVLSLNTSALIHLGEAPDANGQCSVNLSMARQTIDMLVILEEKTRGNLTGEEERILNQVLFDLRMRYVQRCK